MSIGPKTPYRCKNLADISYRDRVIANFCFKFRCHGNGGRWAKMQLATLHSMALHWKHPYKRKNLAYISYTNLVIAFLSEISLPWQPGSIGGKCDSQHSMANPRKPAYRRKNLPDISYTRRVIANFVPNFFAIATGVDREKTRRAAFNGPSPKPPVDAKISQIFLTQTEL